MFLLHCLRRPCCGPVTSSEILVADCSKKLKDFGSSLRTSFFALFSAKSKIVLLLRQVVAAA
jgi:hypothetical protein